MLRRLERSLLYYPVRADQHWQTPPSGLLVEDVWLQSPEGMRVHALWCPRSGAQGSLLYCHGNAGNLSHRLSSVIQVGNALNRSVLVFDYPGYGRSDGIPSEAGCYASANAAYDWLTEREHPERIVLFGKSLGGGVATDLALRKTHAALILAKTFTSIPDMARHVFPWLPIGRFLHNRFDSLAKIGRCPRPIFIAHGDRDELIPLEQGRRLFAAAPEPKRFFLMHGCGHNGPFPSDCLAALVDFIQASVGSPAALTR